MSSSLAELLDLVARWVHVIAGIMWVGNSMLFNWLDRNLRDRAEPDVYGDIWLLHSGGFYFVEKNQGERAPDGARREPVPLHWFKWQAYTTWITGAVLMIVVFYLGGRAVLTDPAVRDIPHRQGVVAGAGAIVIGWVLYDVIWRTIGVRRPGVAGALSIVSFVGITLWLSTWLSGRAGMLHIGALLATVMAGNVFTVIVPSQRELVAALRAGREPSQAIADRAKARSIHNNYITFPVIALMVSGHFPSLYADLRWPLYLIVLVTTGAALRHFMNIRFTKASWKWGVVATVAAGIALLLGLRALPALELPMDPAVRHSPREGMSSIVVFSASNAFEDARRVIDRRCAACHSDAPSDVTFGAKPAGVAFDTPPQIQALAARIRERAVVTKTMPPGNKTRMTEAERAILAAWIGNGARVSP